VVPLRVVRYLCPRCEASFQVLPAFVARHLWHTWPTVEAHTLAGAQSPPPPVPARTQRRWRTRLACAAALLVALLCTGGSAALEGLAVQVGLQATRGQLVAAYQGQVQPPPGRTLGSLAALLHRLSPRVRLL
jgi:hypothetical protein